MQSIETRASTEPGRTSLSPVWALALGAAGSSLVALTVAAQIYLSMLHHGHSFARIVVWQLCSWSVWAAATPIVLRLGGRLTIPAARSATATLNVLATGLVILVAHMLIASMATVWLQPYIPVERFRLGAALILQVISVPVDLRTRRLARPSASKLGEPSAEPSHYLQRLSIKQGERTIVLRTEEIIWIEAQDYCVTVHSTRGHHLVRASLTSLEGRLAPEMFVRAHRTAIVNVKHVRETEDRDGLRLVLSEGTHVGVSRSRRSQVELLLAPRLR